MRSEPRLEAPDACSLPCTVNFMINISVFKGHYLYA